MMRYGAFERSRARCELIAPILLLLVGCAQEPGSDEVRRESRRDILGTEENLYSQHNEELFIRDFFQDEREGIFLDVGCAWPVAYSNTYYLESELGWSGIGVDALPDYEKNWRNRRPRSKFFNYIVTDHSGTIEKFYRTANRELLGISSVGRESRPNVDYEEIDIPTITLNELLDQNGITHLDLLSMDIEGAELLALAGFDIERFRPTLACVEVHGATAQLVLDYFESHGYERIERFYEIDRVNFFFQRKADSETGTATETATARE